MEKKMTAPGAKAPDKKRNRKKGKPAESGLFVEIDLGERGFDPAALFDKDSDAIGSYVYHPEIVAPKRQRDPYRVIRRQRRSSSMGKVLLDAGATLAAAPVALVGGLIGLFSRPGTVASRRSAPRWLMPAGATAAVAGVTAWLLTGVTPAGDPALQQILAQNSAEKAQLATRLAADETLINAARSRVVQYTTKAGDTVQSLAQRYHLSENTIRQANNLLSRRELKPGLSLTILPVNGVLHEVAKGETSLELAYRYELPLAKIKEANKGVDLDHLQVGQKLVIPGASAVKGRPEPVRVRRAEKPSVRLANAGGGQDRSGARATSRTAPVSRSLSVGGGRFVMPTVGQLSSNYGRRWGSFHRGVDIAASPGTTIRAARDGVVVSAGWDGAYGQAIVISHGNGLSTRYGHCSRLFVSPGQRVEAGQPIGAVGMTGRATGPHVHFEVLVNGSQVNPLAYL